MKKVIAALLVAAGTAAIAVPLAFAGGGNSEANACKQGGWQNLLRQDGTGFKNQGDCVSYAVQGGTLVAKAAPATAVSEPMFNYNVNTCSVRVPYTPGLDTVLYGVNGYGETPITRDVTVTAGLDGLAGTAGQFWIGYKAQPGYVVTNPGAGTSHIDFYNGDYVSDCTIHGATGDVTWDYKGLITGHVSFNANATGGSLAYQNSNGQWLHGVVTSYRQIDDHTAVFAGTIDAGSPDYTDYHAGTDYFFAKVVDNGSTGDQIAVLANAGYKELPNGAPDISGDYDMSQGAGIVTAGNLAVH